MRKTASRRTRPSRRLKGTFLERVAARAREEAAAAAAAALALVAVAAPAGAQAQAAQPRAQAQVAQAQAAQPQAQAQAAQQQAAPPPPPPPIIIRSRGELVSVVQSILLAEAGPEVAAVQRATDAFAKLAHSISAVAGAFDAIGTVGSRRVSLCVGRGAAVSLAVAIYGVAPPELPAVSAIAGALMAGAGGGTAPSRAAGAALLLLQRAEAVTVSFFQLFKAAEEVAAAFDAVGTPGGKRLALAIKRLAVGGSDRPTDRAPTGVLRKSDEPTDGGMPPRRHHHCAMITVALPPVLVRAGGMEQALDLAYGARVLRLVHGAGCRIPERWAADGTRALEFWSHVDSGAIPGPVRGFFAGGRVHARSRQRLTKEAPTRWRIESTVEAGPRFACKGVKMI
eukprot:tig00000492_g1411.t1